MDKNILVGMVIGLLLLTVLVPSSFGVQSEKMRGYVSHAPIRIDSDAEFAAWALIESWHGNGTASNPYIISGYDIDAQRAGDAIYIGNTTVYFVIENCHFHNGSYKSWYFSGSGIHFYNLQNGTVNNVTTTENDHYGINIYHSDGIKVTNNTVYDNWYGIHMDFSDGVMIVNNAVYNAMYGIYVYESTGVNVVENKVFNIGYYGIDYEYSNDGVILNNVVYNISDSGIHLHSNNNLLKNNVIKNISRYGIFIDFSSSYNKIYSNEMITGGIFIEGYQAMFTTQDIPTNNTVNGKPVYYYKNLNFHNTSVSSTAGQVILGNVTYLNIESLEIRNVSVPIEIGYSSHIYVRNNLLWNSSRYGVFLSNSDNITVDDNTIKYGKYGISVHRSDNNKIVNNHVLNATTVSIRVDGSYDNVLVGNTVSNCSHTGIELTDSDRNMIKGNMISNSGYYGILIISSQNNKFYSNIFVNDGMGISTNLNTLTTQTIPFNNTVNGKPLYYYKNVDMNNALVPSDAGQIILGNVTNLRIKDIDIQYADTGMQIVGSSHVQISNSIISYNNQDGIHIHACDNITIKDSSIYNNYYGILISYSSNNIVVDNNSIYNNDRVGIIISGSTNNLVVNNNISSNGDYGVYLDSTTKSWIYNNSFYYNHGSGDTYNSSCIQAYDRSAGNWWNSTSGIGNYWHDWANNNDTNDQNGDGIVDWPYLIDGIAGAKDYYPLTEAQPIPELSSFLVIVLAVLVVVLLLYRKKH